MSEAQPHTEFPAPDHAPPRTQHRWFNPFTALLFLAVALRVWLICVPNIGHQPDLQLFARWMRGLSDHGLAGFYSSEKFCDYPPLAVLAMRGLAALVALFDRASLGEYGLQVAVKSLAGIADLAIGALLAFGCRPWLSRSAARTAAVLFLLNPVSLYNGVFWGQWDSVYAALALGAFVAAGRRAWLTTGLLAALSLTTKFQAIVFLPLLLLECLRVARGLGVVRLASGAAIGIVAVLTPFASTGALKTVLERSYVHVVGQYPELSRSAFNIWYWTGDPNAPDYLPPDAIVKAVANGRPSFDLYESWRMGLTTRRVALALFSLSIAVTLSVYTRRPGGLALFAAGGAAALCFFLFPTEMHERYAFAAVAFLAPWAAARLAAERVYWLLSGLLALNLAAFTSPVAAGPQIAAALVLILGLVLAAIWREPVTAAAGPPPEVVVATAPAAPVFGWFRHLTELALLVAAGFAAMLIFQCWNAAPLAAPPANSIWLSALKPREVKQDYKTPAMDREVDGGWLRLGDTVYVRGIGTHAAARLVFDVPPNAEVFETITGIDASTGDKGKAMLRIELDGKAALTSDVLSGGHDPFMARILVRGAKTMTLVIDPQGDNKSDHVDLALARFIYREKQ